MKFDPDRHHRRSIRLPGYDYTRAGAYFITICTYQRACMLGAIQDGVIALSPSGQIVEQCWRNLPSHFMCIELDAFVVMPNHLHAIIIITESDHSKGELSTQQPVVSSRQGPETVSPRSLSLPNGTQSGSLSAIIQNFKSVSTRKINQALQNRGATVWQRGYYERIIRDEAALNNVRRYIEANPARWADDEEHRND